MMWYPLTFRPIFKPRIWGGRRLEELFGKPLPTGQAIGESWELSGLAGDESIVAAGPLAGQKLTDLAARFGGELIGPGVVGTGAAFPLLIKLLDAGQPLSVQVHPSKATIAQARAAVSASSAQPKNECWYIMAAEPGARIWVGLKEGVDREQFAAAAAAGNVADLLRACPVRAGDFFYLPGGTVHALGGGIVVAEVQTPSDTTYRVFDWNRVDPATGQPRTMHLAEALDAIDYGASVQPASAASGDRIRLLGCPTCEDFVIDKLRLSGGTVTANGVGGRGTMVIWQILRGTGRVECPLASPGPTVAFGPGSLLLFPAAMEAAAVRVDAETECELLEISLPT